MTTSIQSLAIRQNGVHFGNADSHTAFSSSQDNGMCANTWHHADNGMLNGFLKHPGTSLPERFYYVSHEFVAPQNARSRVTLPVSNGGYLGYSQQGLYSTQGLGVSNMLENTSNTEQLSTTWLFEKPPLNVQEYQCSVEEIKETAQGWPAKHYSLLQPSQSANKNNEAPGPQLAGTFLEASWDSVLESSLHMQEDVVRAGHSSRESPCSSPLLELASEGVAADSSVAPLTFCEDSQPLEPGCIFKRVSRRRSLYRRRASKKVQNFSSDALMGDPHILSLNTKCIESASTSHGFGPVVESPDWLPLGWLTEMKTRASGTSAGCKYKCYVDPVTKRRFRTRKEVFCFLTTGSTGRYKPKSKVEQNGEHYSDGITKGSAKLPVFGLQNILQGPNLAGERNVNGTDFLQRSWQYHAGRSAYGGMVNIQAAALKLLTDDDDMILEEKARLFARFSPRPIDLYGLRIPARNFKKIKAQGKEGLEALGKVICQQGLSILRKSNDLMSARESSKALLFS